MSDIIRGEKRKTIIFNLDNAQERAMYELASRTNFSRLVKRYMLAELQRLQAQKKAQEGSS
jgi:predicted transcriptional regulator